ncbi:MAG: FtsX-like permease family protein [Desulfobacteraceae bacterium]|nr:FtsX-like permease family protein [Desulfobacteraceae bacterium]MBC2749546.1 ABC transporter permease [Desulfobacteraceae bacterium]
MPGGMLSKMIIRELRQNRQQTTVLFLCIVLSVVGLTALGGFQANVHQAMLRDARELHAADVIVRSSFPFLPAMESKLAGLTSRADVAMARVWEFYTVVRTPDASASLLSAVKVVEPGYPYYGRVVLASGEPFHEMLAPGDIVVEQTLLDRLGLAIGSRLFLGDAEMTIRDVVISEPDRPVTVFTLGPRIFVSARDRQRLGLITQGSRVRYMALLRLPASLSPEAVQEELWSAADPTQERVDTFRSADSRLKRFFDNLLFFLKLVGIFTLLLAGIGIQSVLTALMRARVKTMATMKALGAPNRFVMRLYLGVVLLLGIFGTACGIAAGLGLQQGLTFLLADLIPADATFEVAWGAVGQSLVVGLLAVVLFAARPLLNLKHFKPSALFRHEKQKNRWLPGEWLTVLLTTLFFVALVLWQLEDLRIGAYFIGGLLVLVGVAFLGTWLFLKALQRLAVRHLALRQAIRGLFRPRNATLAILVTLTASLTIIYAIFLIEKNLDATFVQAYPQDAPNVFFLDIQRDQTDAFAQLVDRPLEFYPIVRAKLMAINGQAIDPGRERQRKSDNLARPFNLTYRHHLLDDEKFVEGNTLFNPNGGTFQVSVLDRVADIGNIRMGDRLQFKIQGVPLEATVSSIRTRTRESMQPFFYFVFPDAALQKAPQAIFTALRVDPSEMAALQNRIVQALPNVTVLDVSQSIRQIAGALDRFSQAMRFFTLFSMAAGILLVVSSIIATRAARIREAVYYKILGAPGRFVLYVFSLENLLLGGASAAGGLLLAHLISWVVCVRYFDIAYQPYPAASLAGLMVGILAVVLVGLSASRSIMRRKPIQFLRAHAAE